MQSIVDSVVLLCSRAVKELEGASVGSRHISLENVRVFLLEIFQHVFDRLEILDFSFSKCSVFVFLESIPERKELYCSGVFKKSGTRRVARRRARPPSHPTSAPDINLTRESVSERTSSFLQSTFTHGSDHSRSVILRGRLLSLKAHAAQHRCSCRTLYTLRL